MFAPSKTWHCGHRRVNIPEAICHLPCMGASVLPELLVSQSHRIQEVPKLPLVAENKVEGYKKTKTFASSEA